MKVLIPSGRASLVSGISGNGHPIIFLHTAVTDKRMWNAQMECVGLTNKVIAYDRRGFGESTYEEEIFSSVADLFNVTEKVADNQPPILIGCSQGGRIALDAAVLHPSKISGLVLIAPNIPGAPEARHSKEIMYLLSQQKNLLQRIISRR